MRMSYIEYKQQLDNSSSIKVYLENPINPQQKLEIVEIPLAEMDTVYNSILNYINFYNMGVPSYSSPPLAVPDEPNPVKKFIAKRLAPTCRYRYYRLTSDMARRTVIFEWK